MKHVKNLFVGLILTVIGIVLFLQNLTFKDPSNNGLFGGLMNSLFGNTSPKAVSGALFVIVLLMVLLFSFLRNGYALAGLLFSIIVSVLVVVGSMDVAIAEMSGLEIGIISVLIMVGIGLIGNAIISLTVDGKKAYRNQ